MKNILVVIAFLVGACTTANILKDDDMRARIMASPEMQEILGTEDVQELTAKWCALSPGVRLLVRIEVETKGVKLPLTCSENLS